MNDKQINIPTIKEILKKNNIKIKKSLGQNFLFDINITDKIVKKSEPIKQTIIEVGPGPGSLTRSILKKIFIVPDSSIYWWVSASVQIIC